MEKNDAIFLLYIKSNPAKIYDLASDVYVLIYSMCVVVLLFLIFCVQKAIVT